jgi:serine/threonine protein kinase
MSTESGPSPNPPRGAIGFQSLGPDFVPPPVEEIQAFLPQLEVLSFIRHGGMGTFYRASQPKLDRTVAIKILPVDEGTDADLIDAFKREASGMAGLSHPHVIGIYDFGQSGSYLYLLMEFVEGDILERLIEARDFELSEILAIVTQVCDALHYAHERGVIHRDLRPGNTLLNTAGRVKVGDFGLARLVGEELFRRNLNEQNQAMGTLDYVAPEQLEPGHPVDHRADIYSLGMLLYKLLTHELPRGTFTPPSAIVPGLDSRLDEIVIRCMQRNPDNRYQGVAEVWNAVHTLHSTLLPSKPPGPRLQFPGA